MGLAFTSEERVQLEQLTGKPYDQIDLDDMKALDGKKSIGGIVRNAEGKPAWGEYKMQAAQGALRERMIAEGYPGMSPCAAPSAASTPQPSTRAPQGRATPRP